MPDGDKGKEKEGQAPAGGEPKVLTQEEVNRLIGQARQEERGKYADYDALKERAKKADDLERAQMTEAEKLKADAADWQRKATDAEGRIATTMIQTAIKLKASQKGIVDPEAAAVLIDKTAIAYSEDKGVVGVDEALDKLLQTKPYLKAPANNSNPNLNPGGRNAAPSAKPLTADQLEAAAKLGMTPEDYAKGLK